MKSLTPHAACIAAIIASCIGLVTCAYAQADVSAVKSHRHVGPSASERGRYQTLKTLLPAQEPALGMKKIIVVAEWRLAGHPEIRPRLERYAKDIWKAYGAGVELISLASSSPRYLKGLIRQQMPSGLTGVVLVGKLPKAYGEVFEVHVPRDIFLCDMYFINQNTKGLPAGDWVDPGWLDEGRPWFGIVKSEPVPNIDFNWGESSPDPSVIPVDRFSARYRGTLKPPRSGTYTFTISSDNGRRLAIKGATVIDEWKDDWGKDYSGTIALKAGVPVSIVLDYFESEGGAELHLKWTPPGSKSSSVVPASVFSGLVVDYYNNNGLRDDGYPKTLRRFARNGVFDRVTDGSGGAQVSLMAPHVFVSRIETHTSISFGGEVELLADFFDKDHAYWSGSMALGSKAVLTFGRGTPKPDPVVVRRVQQLFDPRDIRIRVDPRNTSQQYVSDLMNPTNLVSVYCGHGWEGGIGIDLDANQLKGVPVRALLVDLESCSPLRSIGTSEKHPDGYDLPAFIGGAHLFADRGKGRCLAVRGATKTSGGNQHEEFFYRALAKGKPVGIAFKEWARQRMELEGEPAEWFDYFYPQGMIGDPLIVMGAAPRYAKTLATDEETPKRVLSSKARESGRRRRKSASYHPLVKHFNERGYEFGWSRGAANDEDESKVTFFKVTDVAMEGGQVKIHYDWRAGVLSGTLKGNTFRGTWSQDNGRGGIELVFNREYSGARGWWNDESDATNYKAMVRTPAR